MPRDVNANNTIYILHISTRICVPIAEPYNLYLSVARNTEQIGRAEHNLNTKRSSRSRPTISQSLNSKITLEVD